MNNEEIPALHRAATDNDLCKRLTEVHQIVTVVEICHENEVYRVEVLKIYAQRPDNPFWCHTYQRHCTNEGIRWDLLEIGAVRCDSVDSALSQTLGFLRRRTHRGRTAGTE